MKYIKLLLLLSLVFVIFLSSCEDWVQDLPAREDLIADDVLVDSTDINLLITGIKTNFSSMYERSSVFAEILGDAIINARHITQDATYDQWRELEEGYILLNNTSVEGLSNNLGEMWHCATTLVDRINNRMTPMSASWSDPGLFNGYLFEGIAYETYATYYGLNENEGGGCINAGPFIAATDLYDMAITAFEQALDYTTDPVEIATVHSLMARCYLYDGNYANAKTHADQGLSDGNAAFRALYNATADNYWWQQASLGLRVQVIVDDRFAQYIADDPNEANRIPLLVLPKDLYHQQADTLITYWTQAKYINAGDPITYISWQENNLILAELSALRGQSGDAVALVNAVRASHGIADLTTVDQTVIIQEREKELFCTGNRLVDQRRFNLWHLASDTWKYLPITEDERNANENLPNVGEEEE